MNYNSTDNMDRLWLRWFATKYTRRGQPGPRIVWGPWNTLPWDEGQIVTRSYSGHDGRPGESTWMRVFDRSDGSVRYYRRG